MEKPVWDDEQKESKFFNLSFVGTRWFMISVSTVAGILGVVILYFLFTPSPTPVQDVPVLTPSTNPVKVQPENPGGFVVPHQDKKIYENILGTENKHAPEHVVLRPSSEAPMEMPLPQGPLVEEKEIPLLSKDAVIEPVRVEKPQTALQQETVAVPVRQAEFPPKKEAQPEATVEEMIHSEPPVTVVKMDEIHETPALVKAAAAPIKAKPSVKKPQGSFKVQIAAVSSKALAEKEWKTFKRKNDGLLKGKSMVISKADVPQKGTVYRLQLVGFSSMTEAGQFCKRLQDKGANCFAVKK